MTKYHASFPWAVGLLAAAPVVSFASFARAQEVPTRPMPTQSAPTEQSPAEQSPTCLDRTGIRWVLPFPAAKARAAADNRILMVKSIAFGTTDDGSW